MCVSIQSDLLMFLFTNQPKLGDLNVMVDRGQCGLSDQSVATQPHTLTCRCPSQH